MNDTTTQTLRQFTPREWMDAMLRFRDAPALWDAFEPLLDLWTDIAHFKYEDAREFDETWASEEFDLDMHTGPVKCRDIHWLRKTFEANELAALGMRIARLVHPKDDWSVIEGDAHAVAVNAQRSIVVDLLYGHRLSAAASLALAGQFSTAAGGEEAVRFLESRAAAEMARLQSMFKEVGGVSAEESTVH